MKPAKEDRMCKLDEIMAKRDEIRALAQKYKVLRLFAPESQRKQRAFLKPAACALDHKLFCISSSALSLVTGHAEICTISAERDMGNIDFGLLHSFPPLYLKFFHGFLSLSLKP